MSLNPSFGAAAGSPYTPDNLIAGDATVRAETVTIEALQVLARGAVLGRVTATGAWKLSLAAANDGSEVPRAILAQAADAAGGAVQAPIYVAGDFNERRIIIGAGHNLASVKTAFRGTPIFIQSSVHF